MSEVITFALTVEQLEALIDCAVMGRTETRDTILDMEEDEEGRDAEVRRFTLADEAIIEAVRVARLHGVTLLDGWGGSGGLGL